METVKPLKLDSTKQNIWFTSDLHFNHANIIKFCNRPWKTTEEMDEALISNWNSVVKPNDLIFDLGDFAFADRDKWIKLLEQLNGKHYLILGNHDIIRWPGNKVLPLFERVEYQLTLKIDGRKVYFNHYPFVCYGGTDRDSTSKVYQLFGHVHSGPNCSGLDYDRLINLFPYQYDVGVDNNNYTPISWEQVKDKINNQIINAKL